MGLVTLLVELSEVYFEHGKSIDASNYTSTSKGSELDIDFFYHTDPSGAHAATSEITPELAHSNTELEQPSSVQTVSEVSPVDTDESLTRL